MRYVKVLSMSGSLNTAARESAKYRLDLAGIKEVRWDEDSTEPAEDYTLVYGKESKNHHLGRGLLVHESCQQFRD